jgi:hypothetical protein
MCSSTTARIVVAHRARDKQKYRKLVDDQPVLHHTAEQIISNLSWATAATVHAKKKNLQQVSGSYLQLSDECTRAFHFTVFF